MRNYLNTLLIFTLLVLTSHQVNADNIAHKFVRGAAAVGCGFMEFPASLNQETEAHGAWGFPLGFVLGAAKLGRRELVGVYELVTAPLPLPANYQAILEPEYPWSYFKDKPTQPGLDDSDMNGIQTSGHQ
jgi:putative exosortase-associated protein (TIGR04073 family)